jgi:UPF0716 protein FxsA
MLSIRERRLTGSTCALVAALLLLYPVVELYAFLAVARQVGLGGAVLGLAASALCGLAIIRVEGQAVATLDAFRRAVRRGDRPHVRLLETLPRLLAALLLLLPGFASDAVALVILLPPVSRAIARRLDRAVGFRILGPRPGPGPQPPGAGGAIIEGEVVRSRNVDDAASRARLTGEGREA